MTITPAPAALGVTVSDWVDQLHGEYLSRQDKAELDVLDATLTTTATTIAVAHGATGLRSQAQVEIEDELLHVWAPGSTAGQFSVRRAMNGSTAVQHVADSLLRVDPRWPRIVLARQLGREIRSWPTAVYAVASGELTGAASGEAVDLDGMADYDVLRILRVQYDPADTTNDRWPALRDVGFERRQSTAFPSGYALRFPGTFGQATTLRVAVGYRHPVPVLNFADDLGTAYHLNQALADAAMLGVAGRLLATAEVERTDDRAQPRPRRAEEVPPGHQLQTGQALLQERDRLLRTEAERLLSAYSITY